MRYRTPPGHGREVFTATSFITRRRVQISQICVRYEQCRAPDQAAHNGGSMGVVIEQD
jgi:hypothetical protein